MERSVKSAEDSRTERTHILFPRSLNNQGRLFGGELLGWIDEIAGVVAMRHCGRTAVTASIEHMDFKAGAGSGDLVYICGHLTYVGNSSMEVRIDSYVESIADGRRRLINTAFFVMVAVDEEGRPVQVPGLRVETINEQAEWEAGKKRQALRRERRREGY